MLIKHTQNECNFIIKQSIKNESPKRIYLTSEGCRVMKRLMNIPHEMHKEFQRILPGLLILHTCGRSQLELLHRRCRVENCIHIVLTAIDIIEHARLGWVIVGWVNEMHRGCPLVLGQETDLIGPRGGVGEEPLVRIRQNGADLAGGFGGEEQLGNLARQRMACSLKQK